MNKYIYREISGEGHGNPLQYSWLENPMDRGAWWAIVHGVTKNRTWLSDQHTHTNTHIHTYNFKISCVFAKSLQLCLTLCDPMDCSPPGSSVYGIIQARILEWIAISFSRGFSWPSYRSHGLLHWQALSLLLALPAAAAAAAKLLQSWLTPQILAYVLFWGLWLCQSLWLCGSQ